MDKIRRFQQDTFYISTFNAISSEEHMRAQLQHHKDTGFNLVEFTFKDRETVLRALPICEELGLKSIVQDRDFGGIGFEQDNIVVTTDEMVQRAAERYAPFKEVLGFYVWDEPAFENFSTCRDTINRFRRFAPDKLGFSVMVPSYGIYAWQANDTWTGDVPLEERPYAKYVRQYIEETDCDVVSVDYYPFAVSKEARLIENDMWRDMGCVRKYAKAAGRPFWFYFQGKWDFPASDDVGGIGMTYEKLAVQAYAALAYGVKQLSYFTSSSLVSVTTDAKGPLYDEVKRLNHKMMNLGTFLLHKESDVICHTGLPEDLRQAYFLDGPEDIAFVRAMPDRLIAGTFTDGTNAKYLMLSNKDFENAVSGELQLDGRYAVSLFDDEDGTLKPLGCADRAAVTLAPGEGRLYVLNPIV